MVFTITMDIMAMVGTLIIKRYGPSAIKIHCKLLLLYTIYDGNKIASPITKFVLRENQ
jgi:hypothetical protein